MAVRVSSAKPSVNVLIAKSNEQAREFTLLNIPFYLVNRLEKLIKPPELEN